MTMMALRPGATTVYVVGEAYLAVPAAFYRSLGIVWYVFVLRLGVIYVRGVKR